MPCTNPIRGYRGDGGRICFTPTEGHIGRLVEIPCSRCIYCRREKARQWAVRIMHEASLHRANSFVTLTYDDEHLPTDLSLDVRHWQLFAKRLRERVGPFRFFHCGEYGEQTARPHYHAIIFGQDFGSDRKHHKTTFAGDRLYSSSLLEDTWGMGYAPIGDVTFESASYVAGYVLKKVTGDQAVEVYGERKPPYATMSRRPGIGAAWFEKFKDQAYPRDEVVMRGRAMRPPKYYDTLMEREDPELMASISRERKREGILHSESDWKRIKAIGRVHEADAKRLQREPGGTKL